MPNPFSPGTDQQATGIEYGPGRTRRRTGWQAVRVFVAQTFDDLAVPPRIAALTAGRPARPVWRNELGGLTFEVGTGTARTFIKWSPRGCGLDLDREAQRLRWAARFTPVPVVLDCGIDADGQWLVTRAVPGEMAVADRWRARPRTAVTAIAEGLRALHDTLPVEDCPFTWGREERVATAAELAAAGRLDPSEWNEAHADLPVREVFARLADAPDDDVTVVCHGDACAPNTLIGDDGRCSGHVDLGTLGVADRWADLAVGSWSLDWNYGPGWRALFFDVYGVPDDPDRVDYYRLLWEMTP